MSLQLEVMANNKKARSAEQTGNLVLGTAVLHARTIWLQVRL